MKKILIKVKNKTLSFSIYTNKEKVENLNNTNVIDIDQMIFSDTYIEKNVDLLRSFLKLVALKNETAEVFITQNEIAPLALKVIRDIEIINKVIFDEDKTINYNIFEVLCENKYITEIDCYSMPNFMFDKLDISKNIKIKSRCEILFLSNFMEVNNFYNYSDLYYKKIIDIKSELTKEDKEDLTSFFKLNNNLKLINLYYYDDDVLIELMHLIKDNNKKNIKIIIHQKKKDNVLFLVEKIEKTYKNILKVNRIKLKIKYSKEYRDKNTMKQINLILFRVILVGIILISFAAIIVFKLKDYKEASEVEKINDSLEEIKVELNEIDGTQEEDTTKEDQEEQTKHNNNGYQSPYYRKFNKAFEELLKINDETVGWLKVNNTKIDYPVVQHKDNDYYLNHSYYKEKNLHGWVFMDYRNNKENFDSNTIIYAHRNSSGLMFGTLKNTLEKKWHDNPKNLVITFNTLKEEHKWQIFSIYTIKNTNDYLNTNFSDEITYAKFLNKIKGRSIKNFKVEVNEKDKILTLSTCYNNADYRLVVHAKLIK